MPAPTDNCIACNTSATKALDHFEVKTIGGINCHYALRGNKNDSHPEQQDRAAIYALPDIKPKDFQPIIHTIFKRMEEQIAELKKPAWDFLKCQRKEFTGDCCVTLTMFDPRSGNLAIGSKGDAAVYLVLKHKTRPGKPIIQRISSPFECYWQYPEGRAGETVEAYSGPNCIGMGMPVMWANAKDVMKETTAFHINENNEPFTINTVPHFELLNLKDLINNILGSGNTLSNYNVSLLMASDGITAGDEEKDKRLTGIANSLYSDEPNKARAILDRVVHSGLDEKERSSDNLSAIVLHNIALGKGEPVAVFIGDGNYQADEGLTRRREGSVAAQVMSNCFEEQMQELRKHGMQFIRTPPLGTQRLR